MPLFDTCCLVAEEKSHGNAVSFSEDFPKSQTTNSNDTTNQAEGRATRRKMRETIRDVDMSLTGEVGLPLDDVDIDEVRLWEVEHLGLKFPSEAPLGFENAMGGTDYTITPPDNKAQGGNTRDALRVSTFVADIASLTESLALADQNQYNKLIGESECVLADLVRVPGGKTTTKAFVRAGPRRNLHFFPEDVNAAIVTCGGLCPGLNNCIREVTRTLSKMYGTKGKVYGIRGGFAGFYSASLPPIVLTEETVEDIHHRGGTFLASSRGGFDLEKIITFLEEKDIKQLYVIGGDGTHRGAFNIHEECMARNMNVAVAGIPKTIDNDIDHIDRTFGFQSAVEAAQKAIRAAKVEATCNLPNGIGIVKLMGRSAGFIAAHASLGSGDVDLCLIPEVPIQLEGEYGVLPHLFERVNQKGFAVVVVAEGAGEEILGESTETDASGNKKLPQIGEFMKSATEAYFKKRGETATVKYIDPSYMVRSIPANAADTIYCMKLAQNAVHGCMAGFTGFSVGLCNNKMVMLPIPQLVATSPRHMDPKGRTWERVVAITRQPSAPSESVEESKNSSEEQFPGTLLDDIRIRHIFQAEIEHLRTYFKSEAPKGYLNTMHGYDFNDELTTNKSLLRASAVAISRLPVMRNILPKKQTPYNRLIKDGECVIYDIVLKPSKQIDLRAFPRAGPREILHFNPKTVNAAIVTCGGLCPGLNVVVRSLTHSLIYEYGIGGKVWGIRGGFKGFYDPKYAPMVLTPETVENIHHKGGTVLSSSRGGFDMDKLQEFIRSRRIKQLYIVGGDGTHKGAFRIHEECMKRGLNVAVAGIPKTIDNDIDYLDRTFGFQSAVEAAQDAIRCAKVEASCNLPNGIGIVKLMGRSAGFIAAYATLGSGDVDLCLVPEVPIVLEGRNGCLPHLYNRIKKKGFAVIVVAEGAGEEILGASTETDASGNKKLPQIGEFMKKTVEEYFKKKGETATVKYIDPSYMVRSVPANADDSMYCMQLAQNAVHGCMAGYTGFSVGLCNNKMVMLPIPQLVATSPREISDTGRTWERVLGTTGQPNTVGLN